MNRLLLSVKILKSGNLIEKLVFNEVPETENQIKYMGIIKIGKMSTSHIKLNDANVSRMHGIIENIDGKFYFTFMGKEETLLNKKALEQNEKTELLNESIVDIGDLSLKFYLGLDIFDSEEGLDEEIVQGIIESDVREVNSEEESDVFTPVEGLLIEDDTSSMLSVLKERRATDKDIYFNNTVEDEIMLKESIGKGIEIKHYWRGNLVDSKLFPNKSDIATIGGNEEDTFFIDKKLLPKEKSFKILEKMGEVYFLKDNVKYIEAEDIYNLEELIQAQKAIDQGSHGAIRLLFRTKIAFEIGDNRIEISHVPLYKTAGKSILAPILDGLNVKFSTLAALVHFLIIFVVYLIPPELETFNLAKLNQIPERYAKVILDDDPKVKKKKEKVKFKEKVTKKNVKFDKNASTEYKFESKNAEGKLSKRKQKTKDLIKDKGFFGIKKGLSKGIGSGTYKGMEDDEIRLNDSANVTASDSGYSGIRGGSSGAGGTGTSIGTGGPSTNGYRNNTRGGISGISSGKRKRRPIIGTGGPIKLSNGSLSRSQIQRVVSKGLSQIRYCYEKALLRSPKLKGNVTLSWRITPRGKVISVKIDGATLKNNKVHSCMKAKVKNWRFPEPKGGGYAQVKYPFNFRSN